MIDPRESIPPTIALPPPQPLNYWVRWLAITAVVTSAALLTLTRGDIGVLGRFAAEADWSPQAPNLAPLAAAGPVVWLHLATVLGALGVGVFQLVGPKGRLLHRILGWTWVGLMVATAVDTLFIRNAGVGPQLWGWGPLHLFSVWTLIMAPLAVYAARRHKVARHQRMMTGLFFGGLILTALLAFFPGRAMHLVLFG
jgi:uncharacterized membrane protein